MDMDMEEPYWTGKVAGSPWPKPSYGFLAESRWMADWTGRAGRRPRWAVEVGWDVDRQSMRLRQRSRNPSNGRSSRGPLRFSGNASTPACPACGRGRRFMSMCWASSRRRWVPRATVARLIGQAQTKALIAGSGQATVQYSKLAGSSAWLGCPVLCAVCCAGLMIDGPCRGGLDAQTIAGYGGKGKVEGQHRDVNWHLDGVADDDAWRRTAGRQGRATPPI